MAITSDDAGGPAANDRPEDRVPNTVPILPAPTPPVKRHSADPDRTTAGRRRPGRPKTRRQSHGSAWHWKQTDCWYYTLPGTKTRVPLLNEEGERIRGKENRKPAQLALARVHLDGTTGQTGAAPVTWVVARVCSEYLQHLDRGVAGGTTSPGYRASAGYWLNDLCRYCGALTVAELKKGHLQTWVGSHPTWRSPATTRSVLTVVIAAFNHAAADFDIPNPLKGLKKPAAVPRLHSLTDADERTLLGATDQAFRDFLFAAIRTGLRPFCELARLTAEDVEVTPRGMM